MTYPDATVKSVLAENAVLCTLNVMKERDLSKRFRIFWTPTFVFADPEGNEFHRMQGYLPPPEFAAQVLLGTGLAHFQRQDFESAGRWFDTVLQRFGATLAAPSSRYWKGVCMFKRSKDTTPIYEACREIVAKYPGSEMAMKLGFVTKYQDFNLKP